MKQLLNAILTILLCGLIYFNQNNYLLINLFILIFISTINNNLFAYISIIPLIKINPTYFFILLIISLLYLLISKCIKKTGYKLLSIATINLIFYTFSLFQNLLSTTLIILLIILQFLFIISKIVLKKYPSVSLELLIMLISILNYPGVSTFVFVLIFLIVSFIINYLYPKNFFIFTTFFVMLFLLYKTNNYTYALTSILAYLPHFLLTSKKRDPHKNVELLLDDINQNISDFCALMNDFSNDNFNSNWEKRVSSSIMILIETNCKSCKNRSQCYTNLKFKTYKYLKNILLNNNEVGYFTCIYYSDMVLQAKELAIKYNLKQLPSKDGYHFDNLSLALSNYFIALFQKITPNTIKIINFKQQLDANKIKNYHYQIFNENHYSIEIETENVKYLKDISLLASNYFPKMQIKKEDLKITITPKIEFFVSYDSATLSHNNYQLSGDNYLVQNLQEGIFICALADGMGSGYEAYKLSSETLKMISRITKCTLDFETSLTILNNFFKIKDFEEAYSTLDFVDINLIDGKMNLYKLGSSTTYIIREDKIIPIYNNNLPFGINDLITREEYLLKKDDLIILISDGITDYISETKLQKLLLSLKKENPHKIVYDVLQGIYHENNNKINDDMTCIALKIGQNVI